MNGFGKRGKVWFTEPEPTCERDRIDQLVRGINKLDWRLAALHQRLDELATPEDEA